MAGNSFGVLFKVTTCGESHGEALMAIIDGCPPGIEINNEDIQKDLDKRKPGQSKYTTQRKEDDKVEIISGVFNGKTTGTPIGLVVKNTNQKPKDYKDIEHTFRPNHADYTYFHKYGIRDHRGGGRASARETVMRVAAGAIAKKILFELGVSFISYCSQIGHVKMDLKDQTYIDKNPFFSADPDKVAECIELIDSIRKEGDSIGAEVTVKVKNIPIGLGEPVFDKLDASIAHAMMSINAVKAVATGDGFSVVTQKGSDHRDEITAGEGFLSNHSGGILGGISTGQDLDVKIAFKPTSSITLSGKTIDKNGKDALISTKGRHDPCVGIRGVPIAEAMLALTLVDHYLRDKAQNKN